MVNFPLYLMDVEFDDSDLDRLETDGGFTDGYPNEVVTAYRRRMQAIRAAINERDLYAVRGNRFEKLKGNRSHQHSIRLNRQWRLIVEIRKSNSSNILVVVGIEDYH